jgi:hypothetical protein
MSKIAGGDGDEVGAKQASHDWIDGEAELGDDDIGAGAQEGVSDELEEFIGAVAEDEVGWGDVELISELLFQVNRHCHRDRGGPG